MWDRGRHEAARERVQKARNGRRVEAMEFAYDLQDALDEIERMEKENAALREKAETQSNKLLGLVLADISRNGWLTRLNIWSQRPESRDLSDYLLDLIANVRNMPACSECGGNGLLYVAMPGNKQASYGCSTCGGTGTANGKTIAESLDAIAEETNA